MQRIEMYIRAGSVKGVLVTARNQQIATPPAITRGMHADLAVRLLAENGTALSGLDNYATWDFAIAHDWDTATAPQIHVSEGIEIAGNEVRIPLRETDTVELKEALGVRESAIFGCELAGYEAGGTAPGFLVQFEIVIRNRRHTAESSEPIPVEDVSFQAAQIRALFAAALSVQLSDDRTAWYDVPDSGSPPSTARWFRVRNAAAGRDWSEAIPLLGGGGGSDSAFAAWRSSESIAAGEGAVADGPNATAFGFNAVAAGPGSMTAIGTDTKASCNFSTAVGNYCTEAAGAYAAAFGSWAKALADGCVQLGTGQNEHANTLQFRDYQLLDADGKIPAERLTGYPAIAGLDPDALADADHTSFAQVCAAVSAIVKALKNQ
jgi:hypothetical protein